MILKTVSATYDRKVNLGDFNSAHIAVTLWADLEEGDDPATAVEALRQMARHQVMAEMARVDKRLEARVAGIFMGLPVSVQAALKTEDEC